MGASKEDDYGSGTMDVIVDLEECSLGMVGIKILLKYIEITKRRSRDNHYGQLFQDALLRNSVGGGYGVKGEFINLLDRMPQHINTLEGDNLKMGTVCS